MNEEIYPTLPILYLKYEVNGQKWELKQINN